MEIFESLESSLNELSDHPFVDAHHTGSSFVAKASPEPSKVIHKVNFYCQTLGRNIQNPERAIHQKSLISHDAHGSAVVEFLTN